MTESERCDAKCLLSVKKLSNEKIFLFLKFCQQIYIKWNFRRHRNRQKCKNFEKFVFLSAELHRAAVDKCLQAFYIQLLINVHRARAPQLLTNSSSPAPAMKNMAGAGLVKTVIFTFFLRLSYNKHWMLCGILPHRIMQIPGSLWL